MNRSTYCLVIDVLLDLKSAIAAALYKACIRTCEFAVHNGNYGLNDDRSSAVFDLVTKNFMSAVKEAYMAVYAGQHKTKDFIAQLDEMPNTAAYSPLWTLLLEVRVDTPARKKQESQQGVDSDSAAKKKTKKVKDNERQKAAAARKQASGVVASNSSSDENKYVTTQSRAGSRMCRVFQAGGCNKGSSCRFAHTLAAKK